MSTSVAAPVAAARRTKLRLAPPALEACLAFAGALLVLLIHGYHPYSSDGSIYVAGIRKVLSPSLYAADVDFVGAHMRLSIFSWVVAKSITLLHVPLDLFLLLSYVVLTAVTLLLAGKLARRLIGDERARWGAMLLLAACFPMPVAATSLLLADPYLTARSLTLPLTLLALLFAADRAWVRAGICCALAALLHPIMGAHLLLFLSVLFLVSRREWRWVALLCGAASGGAALLHITAVGVSVLPAYREAVASRSYYFLARWEWYEWLGLIAPLVLFAAAWRRLGTGTPAGRMVLTCLLVGGTCGLISLCFVHTTQADLLMRVQPLRSFHTIYLVGAILMGGSLAAQIRRPFLLPLGVLLGALAIGMYLNEREIYGPVAHIELPAAFGVGHGQDAWQRAFLWVRAETPAAAQFAIEPEYLEAQGESMPGFRAVAERNILTDLKDEGLVSLFPQIARGWEIRSNLESGLNTLTDAERSSRLKPAGVSWVLLSPAAKTAFSCPFRNEVVQICELPGGAGG